MPMEKPTIQCDCFYGTAYIDKYGNCACDNGIIGKPDYDPIVYTKPAVQPNTNKRPNAINGRKPRYDINGKRIMPATTSEIRCRNRQAPSGYHYGMSNGVCVLMTADGVPVTTVPAPQNTQIAMATNTVGGMATGLISWLTNNPLIALAVVGGGIYLVTKK